jgi:hypothetical protein
VKLQPSLTLSALAAVLAAGALVVAILAATVLDDSGKSVSAAASPQAGEPIEKSSSRDAPILYLTVAHGDPKASAGDASGWVRESSVSGGTRHPDDASGIDCVSAPSPGRACQWQYQRDVTKLPDVFVVLRAHPSAGAAVQWTGCTKAPYDNDPNLCQRKVYPGPNVKATFVSLPKG